MYYIKEADLVIIGAGASGTMAAIYAHRTNPKTRIVVLDKSKMETSGGCGRGMDALNTMAVPPYSYPEDLVENQTKITEGVLDQEVTRIFAERCPEVIKDLEGIMQRPKGDLFPVDENGNYILLYVHPINKPLLQPMDGEELKRALAKAVRDTGAEIYDRTPALRIVTQDGRVSGALAFNIRSGEYFYFKAKAICLTTGCAGRVGFPSSGYLAGCYEFPGNSGDGYAMAYEAGTELVSMECFQAGQLLKDHQGPPCGYIAAPRGGVTINSSGERIWTHGYSSGDSKLGVWKAFAEGKGPTYLKLDHLSEESIRVIEKITWDCERTSRGLFHKRRNQDYRRDSMQVEMSFGEEIGACGGHSCSGILSDINGATNVPGLYVAGDVDAGLPYSGLGGALAMGSLIGEKATQYSIESDPIPEMKGLQAWLKKEIDAFEAPLRRDQGIPTNLVEYKARNRIQHYLQPPKSPKFMEIAIWWMERIRLEDLPEIKAIDYHDLIKVHEIKSILTVGEMMARSSLFRTESRWGYNHWRADIPSKKPDWEGHWVVIRKGKSGMDLCKRRVPAYKWNYPTFMEYSYPKLSFDIGKGFRRRPECKNPARDQWMANKMEKQGISVQKRFMPWED